MVVVVGYFGWNASISGDAASLNSSMRGLLYGLDTHSISKSISTPLSFPS